MSRFFAGLSAPSTPDYLQSAGKLYERQPVTDLWNNLTRVAKKQWQWMAVADKQAPEWVGLQHRLLLVHGPPGTGKSSACYQWSIQACRSSGADVTWFDCAESEREVTCWHLERDETQRNQVAVTEIPGARHSEEITSKIVVFDGLRKSTVGKWKPLFVALARRGVAVLLVSSESVRIHRGNMNDITTLRHRVPSWTLEEYECASADDGFWASNADVFTAQQNAAVDTRNLALDQKFETAGHSARFMFRDSPAIIKDTIVDCADALDNIDALSKALKRQGNVGAVNTLIAWLYQNGPTPNERASLLQDFDLETPAADRAALGIHDDEVRLVETENCFVSPYAARKVLDGMITTVDQLKTVAAATGNRAIEGYALEMHFETVLKTALATNADLTVTREDGSTESWPVRSFFKTKDIEKTLLDSTALHCWMWIGGLQAGFDAVNIYDNNKIRFVQTTAGEKHTFNLYAVDSLLRRLKFFHWELQRDASATLKISITTLGKTVPILVTV
mmetsp:Transcript_25787/g.39564  ORF Transcript_25787/g.39564 Transcript_25787/m.39564 type:complete len:506 (+) Transcript_25787:27-1544(+)